MGDKDKSTAEVVDRKEGYYWIKFDGEWFIGNWSMQKWFLAEWSDPVTSDWFQEIDERQICRS